MGKRDIMDTAGGNGRNLVTTVPINTQPLSSGCAITSGIGGSSTKVWVDQLIVGREDDV